MLDHDEIPRGERGVPCSYTDCQHRFPSVALMKAHKVNDPEHFYCKKCNMDFADWQALTEHKVTMMAPFLEGRVRIRDEKPVHIVCEFCGEGFRSFDGRKRHRVLMHPGDQDIDCPGCSKKFIRAAHMIAHIERDECKRDGAPGIPRWMLHASINHKYIIKEIMTAPDVFQKSVFSPHTGQMGSVTGEEVVDEDEESDQEQGGVALLDYDDDEANMGGYKALEPERDLIDLSPRHNISTEAYSALEIEPTMNITKDMRTISLEATATNIRSALKHERGEESASQASGAWSQGTPLKALIPAAKPTPTPNTWDGLYKDCASKACNILETQFWNPFHADYQIDPFFHPVLMAYTCPFPTCVRDNGRVIVREHGYPTKEGLEEHMRDVHWIKMFRCPICSRRFDSVAALMGHVENTMKCKVKESKKFETFIAEMTGGFLTAQSVSQPNILYANKALIKIDGTNDGDMGGVMTMRFEATRPEVGAKQRTERELV